MNLQKTAILTGANGFIGAHLLRRMLANHWTVHALGRAKAGVAWEERLRQAIAENLPAQNTPGSADLYCHEAEFSLPDLGLSGKLPIARNTRTVLVHLAGDTRFMPSDPMAQQHTNVDNSLNLIRKLHPVISQVVHVSTAYVAGNRTGVILETETNVGQGFHNHYEKSKLEAELAVSALCRQLNLPLVMVRPSIIINDLRHGRSSAFTHLNVLVEVANRIRAYYGIGDGEVVNREIRIPIAPTARPNAAPVDPIVEALAGILESPAAAGKTFHLCHPSPQSNEEVFGLALSAFGIQGKIQLRFVQQLEKPLTRTEEMVARAFRVYLPYLNQSASFDCSNTRALIPQYNQMFPPMTVEYLAKVIASEKSNREQTPFAEKNHDLRGKNSVLSPQP